MRSAVVEVAELVDLIRDLERFIEERYQRVGRIDDLDPHSLMPGMTVEIASDQPPIISPLVECIDSGVNADKATTSAHEVEQSRLLRIAHRQLAAGEEHHGRIAPQAVGREFGNIFRPRDLEHAGHLAEPLQNGLR